MIYVITLLNLLTILFAFKESWGYSRTGSDGIVSLTGTRFDHIFWIVERGVLLHLVALTVLIKSSNDMAVCLVSWLLMFMGMHQFFYNLTMVKLKVEGYKIGFDESSKTTATKTSKYIKITLLIIGIVLPIFYALV